MKNSSSSYYYRSIAGSRDLVTKPNGSKKELQGLEKYRDSAQIEVLYNGERLFKTEPETEKFAAELQIELKGLDPLQQAAFVHFYLLSYGVGANWCRVGMTEFCKLTGMSRRRLLKTISELVEMGRLKPLDRDRNGTLYIIYSLSKKEIVETVNIHATHKILKNIDPKTNIKKISSKQREKPIESPINEDFFRKDKKTVTIRQMAEKYFSFAGIKPEDLNMDEAIGQITYLLEDGFSREEILIGIKYVAEKFGQTQAISKLPYFIEKANEEKDD